MFNIIYNNNISIQKNKYISMYTMKLLLTILSYFIQDSYSCNKIPQSCNCDDKKSELPCIGNVCYCNNGYCAHESKCIPNVCVSETNNTCNIRGCGSQEKRIGILDRKCACISGSCFSNGACSKNKDTWQMLWYHYINRLSLDDVSLVGLYSVSLEFEKTLENQFITFYLALNIELLIKKTPIPNRAYRMRVLESILRLLDPVYDGVPFRLRHCIKLLTLTNLGRRVDKCLELARPGPIQNILLAVKLNTFKQKLKLGSEIVTPRVLLDLIQDMVIPGDLREYAIRFLSCKTSCDDVLYRFVIQTRDISNYWLIDASKTERLLYFQNFFPNETYKIKGGSTLGSWLILFFSILLMSYFVFEIFKDLFYTGSLNNSDYLLYH